MKFSGLWAWTEISLPVIGKITRALTFCDFLYRFTVGRNITYIRLDFELNSQSFDLLILPLVAGQQKDVVGRARIEIRSSWKQQNLGSGKSFKPGQKTDEKPFFTDHHIDNFNRKTNTHSPKNVYMKYSNKHSPNYYYSDYSNTGSSSLKSTQGNTDIF